MSMPFENLKSHANPSLFNRTECTRIYYEGVGFPVMDITTLSFKITLEYSGTLD